MNLAFAGFRHGHIFGLYKSAVENSKVKITGCYEENEEERKKVSEAHGIEFNYNSYEEVLNDESVTAIAIGDYYGKRGSMVIEALKHGKHIICDKPICTSREELDEIEKLSAENGLEVCCMFDLRYMPQTAVIKKMIQNGELGDINIASFTGQHFLDYGNRPWWYFEEGKHGGTINDIAIHGIDLLKFIMGKSVTHIDCARCFNAFAEKEKQFEDGAQMMFRMENIRVMADVSYAAPKCPDMPTYWNFCFWRTKGMASFVYKDNLIHVYKDSHEVIECENCEIDYLNDFIDEINGKDTIMKTKGVIESQREVLKIQESADKEMK